MRNPWNVYLGDCAVVDSYLKNKPLSSPVWGPAHALNIFLRAVGQPAFVNNPLLGLLILIGIFLPDWEVGLGCVLGGGVATITELLFGLHPWGLVSNGVASFNGVLVGTVISLLYPAVYHTDRTPEMWVAIVLGAVISVFFASAFNNFIGKFNVPYMALPFNIIAVCVFLTLQPMEQAESAVEESLDNSTISISVTASVQNSEISWVGVGRGILVSMSQVYAVNNVKASCLMNLAVALSSPLLFLLSSLGAVIGCLLPLAFLPPEDYHQIYDGIWGYNALLAMAAASCVFFPFSPVSFVAGLVNTVATVAIQQGLRKNMDQNHLPVFTVPMTLCTLVILLASQDRPGSCGAELKRCEQMSYPEKQAWQALKSRRKTLKDEEATKEEREPVIKQPNGEKC